MNEDPSHQTVAEYFPVIRAVFASLEVQHIKYSDIDKLESLHVFNLDKEFGNKLFDTVTLIGLWLKNSNFEVKNYRFFKNTKNAKWKNLLAIIKLKLIEHANNQSTIEITMSRSGKIFREINGDKYFHDFDKDGLKHEIIKILDSEGDFVLTKVIKEKIKSKSTASVSKTIAAIIKIIKIKLYAPEFIENKKDLGYRINPKYNLIMTK